MRDLARKLAALTAGASLSVAWGCSGTPQADSSTAKVAISGTVRYKGKPAQGGSLLFDPTNINRRDAPRVTAGVGPDGSYKVETLSGDNLIYYTPKIARPNELNQVRINAQDGTQDLEFTGH